MMQATRRRFVSGGIAALLGIGAAARRSSASADTGRTAAGETAAGQCLDYGVSFICNPSPMNSVRFLVESRTTIYDDTAGTTAEFLQCASCKSENTFGEKDLFYEDNYDFLPIFGGDELRDLLIFRRPARLSDRYRQIVRSEDVWGKPIARLRAGRETTVLETWEQIRDATAAGIPIVTRTQIHNAGTGLRAVIECPVKTMNISVEREMYQVDTGPIAFPDLTKRYDPLIDCLSLAFVAFNAPHFADFVVEQPTPVHGNGRELCRIYHYSNPFSVPAENTVFMVKPSLSV